MNEVKGNARIENVQRAMTTVMSFLNRNDEIPGLIRNICGFLKDWLGCDALGIRLQDGEDFPYYESRGFPEEFLLLETSLCARDTTGAVVRDDAGRAVIECMCGNIILGRVDPSLPFFTPNGSFCSNCTTELLASTTVADRQTRTRNRCNGMGYESVGLFPMRLGDVAFGLVQVNHHARDFFSPDTVDFLEKIAGAMIVGIAQRQAKQNLEISLKEKDKLLREKKASEERAEMLARAVGQERDNLSSMIVSTPIGMLVIDDQEKVIFANPAAEGLFGSSMFGLSHKRFGDIIACSNRLKDPSGCGYTPDCPTCPFFAAIKDVILRGNSVRDKEAMIVTDDTRKRECTWVLFSVSPFVLDKRNCAIMVVYDITERRRAEQQIVSALREKEVLLREIHHRVKNNLQVISSMYSLQAAHITDARVLEIFRESQMRIRSMSLIHDKLYQSKNLAEINVAGYVASLIGDLCISYGVDDSRLKIDYSVADIDLTPDAMIPCGLIVNELVSNAIKHAFPDDRTGRVLVRFDKDGETCTLSVKDDGIGLKAVRPGLEDFSSMGLQLVSILVDQLEGAIEINGGQDGTEFIIAFNVNP